MKKYVKMIREAEESLRFWTHKAMREFVLATIKRMDEQQTSRAQLAETLQVSPAYISKVLRGDVNFTLESMVKISRAVGGRLQVGIVDDRAFSVTGNKVVHIKTAIGRDRATNATVIRSVPSHPAVDGQFIRLPCIPAERATA